MSTRRDEYWEERLLEQEAESERALVKLHDKLVVLREALETALPYVESEGSEVEVQQVKAALRVAI